MKALEDNTGDISQSLGKPNSVFKTQTQTGKQMGSHQAKKFMCSKGNDQQRQNKHNLQSRRKCWPTIHLANNRYSERRMSVPAYVDKCIVCVFVRVYRCVCMCVEGRSFGGCSLASVYFVSLSHPFPSLFLSSSLFYSPPTFLRQNLSWPGVHQEG